MEILENNPKIISLSKNSDKSIGNYFLLDLVTFIMYSNYSLYLAALHGKLYFQANILEKDTKTIQKIFRKYFGENFIWDGNKKTAIYIKITDKIKQN